MITCTSCGSEIQDGSRFCAVCGHPVASSSSEARRIVTVLFADLVGFTTLAEFMDPEQAKRLIDKCFQRLIADITSFGGRVDKILGDGILALFGAPIAHEDDPERAVRAGLRMQESLTSAMAVSTSRHAADIRMRVGINTGEVLVGTLAGTDYTAMGDVVNTASRLQAQAPPGRVIVGPTTHALTAHVIDYVEAGEVIARGRERPVPAWLAVEATAPPGLRRRRRREVPMVGREAEMTIGRTALSSAVCHGRSVLLSVCGESGVGKSRLIAELLRELGDGPALLQGACVPYGESNVWLPAAMALANFYGLESDHSVENIARAVTDVAAAVSPHADPAETERMIEVFTHLLGHPSPIDRLDPASARASIHWTVARALARIAHHRPTILLIDNLHLADPLLIDLLEHVVLTLSRSSFALITELRPGSDATWPPRTDRSSAISLVVHPLSREETAELASRLLGEQVPDARLLGDLYDRSGGNPLFLQELAALTGSGVTAGELPDSLRTLISARLDQLTTAQRQMLDNAATLGTSGSVGALESFARALAQQFDLTTLRELDQLGLLELDGQRWEFGSDSVREAAYQTLTKASRALRHAGVGKALATHTKSTTDELAHHLATAAELDEELGHVSGVPLTIRDDAVRALTAAAARALEAGSLHAVIAHTTRALGLAADRTATGPGLSAAGTATTAIIEEETSETRARLRLMRGAAFVEKRKYAEARTDIEAALGYAEPRGELAIEGEARRLLGTLHQAEGHLEPARAELGRAVELLRTVEQPRLLADALRSRGFVELFGGSLVDAEWFVGEADAIFRSLDDRRGMAWVEQHRAWIGFLSGDMATAHAKLERAGEALQALGDRNGVGWVHGLLAYVLFFERDFAGAEELAVSVAAEAEERGDVWASAMMQSLLANLRLWQGDLEEAVRLADLARGRFRKIDDRYGLSQALAPMLRAQTALGRTANAQRTAEELTTLADINPLGPAPLLALAGAGMHRGDGVAACAYARRAIGEMHGAGNESVEPLIILAVGLAQCARLDEAIATLESIGDARVPEGGDAGAAGDPPFQHAAASLIATLARQPERALAHAAEVSTGVGASYLDRVIAGCAGAGAHAQLGDREAATEAAEAAVALATKVGDVMAVGLSTRCFEAVTGRTHPACDPRAVVGDGWVVVAECLVGR